MSSCNSRGNETCMGYGGNASFGVALLFGRLRDLPLGRLLHFLAFYA